MADLQDCCDMANARREQKLEFNRRLKALRGTRGLTQKEMAEKLGLDRDTYAKYENRSMMPPLLIPEAARILGVSPSVLLPVIEAQAHEMLAAVEVADPGVAFEHGEDIYERAKRFAILADSFIKGLNIDYGENFDIQPADRRVIAYMFLTSQDLQKDGEDVDYFEARRVIEKTYLWYRAERKSGRDPSLDSIENFMRFVA